MIATLLLLLTCVVTNFAQITSNGQVGCTLIDKTRRAQFISYEGLADSNKMVKLRLHNNTNCTVIVETEGYPFQVVKRSGGGYDFETVTGSSDGIKVDIHYLVHNRWKQTTKMSYNWGDSSDEYKLLAGQTIVFTVPLSNFKKRLDVAVPFVYEWEGDTTAAGFVGGVKHHVYFLHEDASPQAK